MSRVTKTLFGQFDARLTAGVFADGWWFFHASNVELAGDARVSLRLAGFVADRAAKISRPVPAGIDVAWIKRVAPVGLGLQRGFIVDAPLRLGLVACCAEESPIPGERREDVAYPFHLAEEPLGIAIKFSAQGPSAEIRNAIAVAVSQRLISASE